jgi:mono/diheme cytochrome c family protein
MDRLVKRQALFGALLLSSLSILLATSNAFADANGRAGYSGVTRSCTNCHTNVATLPMVTLSGAQSVTVGSTNTYTLTVSGGPGVSAGMDVSANGGTLAATMADTKMSGSEVVHSSPTAMPGGTATYTFSWTAPTANGTYTIYAAGLSSNNAGNDTGDATAVTTLMVAVTGATAPTPTPTSANPGGPYTGTVGVPIVFDGSASTGTITTYNWTFGDGTSGAGMTASKTFVTAGTFNVILTVIDNKNAQSQAVTVATVVDPNATPADPAVGEELYIANCESCHGTGGVGGPDGDVLGTSADEIWDAIADVAEMQFLVDVVTEEDVMAIEEFLNPAAGPGADLYVEFCESCHGAEGVGGPDGDVVGADAEDIMEAIEEYPDAMGFLADVLTEEDIAAIGEYLVSLEEDEEEEDDEEEEESFADGGAAITNNGGKNKDRPRASEETTTSTATLDLLALAIAGGLAGALRRRRR